VRMDAPGGKIAHAEIQIGDSMIMLADENPAMGNKSPQSYGGTPTGILLYVEDCDALFQRATAAGANALRPPQDQVSGDRPRTTADPFGHLWTISTHKEDLTGEEIARRAAEVMPKG